VNAGLLLLAIVFLRGILSGRLGKLLIAVRDQEERVRFSGYDVANFKVFTFTMAALLSAVGGAMFTLQVGFMSPSFVGIVPSIEMVIFTAVGGRTSLLGAVYGTLVVNYGKTLFSESFPELWLLLMGSLFIAVVMAFPYGLAGFSEVLQDRLARWWAGSRLRELPLLRWWEEYSATGVPLLDWIGTKDQDLQSPSNAPCETPHGEKSELAEMSPPTERSTESVGSDAVQDDFDIVPHSSGSATMGALRGYPNAVGSVPDQD
jgi:hypothetical protein